MTDRVEGFTVVLDSRIRKDDAESIQKAISQLRGVMFVDPVITTTDSFAAEMRVRTELFQGLLDFLQGFVDPRSASKARNESNSR